MHSMTATLLAFVLFAGAALAAEQNQAGIEIRYSLEQAGKVSLAVYEKDSGRMLRTLLSAAPRAAGEHVEVWDGLDMNGSAAQPGRHEWKLLVTPGLRTEYLLTLGTNTPAEPWRSWPGNHGGVSSVAIDKTGLYLSSSCSEVPPGILKQSLDGKKRFWERGNYEAWQGGIAMAVAGGVLYQLQGNGKVNLIDPATGGKKATWQPTWKEEIPDEKDDKGNPKVVVHGPTDMDAHGTTVAACYGKDDLVRWLDEKGETAREAKVDKPRGLTVLGDGTVLVAASDGILRFAAGEDGHGTFTTQVTAAYRLDADHSTGDVLVAERGDGRHCVKRFSKDGKLLATYGKPEGRTEHGLYDASSFHSISDVTADGAGGFYVCETEAAPRRTAHFDRSGKLISEWYGGQMFFQWCRPDPDDPTIVWMDSHWGWLMQTKVDYEARTWRVVATYNFNGMARGLIPGKSNSSAGWTIRKRNGIKYLVREDMPCVLKIDYANHRLTPLAAARLNVTHYWNEQPEFVRELWENDKRSKMKSFVWTDRNGDGEPQPDEVLRHEWSVWAGGWTIDDDFNVYHCAERQVFVTRCTGFNDIGAPLYANWGKPEPIADAPAGAESLAGYSAGNSAVLLHDGAVYAIFNGRKRDEQPHGWGWTGDMFTRTGLAKLNVGDGGTWVVGRHANTRPNPPGQTHNPCRITGLTHGCIVVGERVVQPAVLWDTDGLYVGTFFDNRADDGLPAELYCWWKSPEGTAGTRLSESLINYDALIGGAIHTLPNGDVLWYAPGWNNTYVYRITGWDGWQRSSGAVAVADTPQHARAAGAGLAAAYFPNRSLEGQPAIRRIDERVAFSWKDGSPGDDVPPDNFSARWEGRVEAQFTEDYIFSTYANDGARLWLDGKLIIDRWEDWAGKRHYHYTRDEYFNKAASEPVPLEAGKQYSIKLEYYEGAEIRGRNEARIDLNWESTTRERQQIPKEFLYTE